MSKKPTISPTAPTEPITRDDLESKLRAFQGEVQGKVDDKRSTLLGVGAGLGVAVLIIFFLLGKRAGKKKTTIVEIKRI